MWLVAVPPSSIILAAEVSRGRVSAAWALMGLLVRPLWSTGCWQPHGRAYDCIARRRASFTSISPTASAGSWRTRAGFRLTIQLADRVPDGARALPDTLDVNMPPRSRDDLSL